MTRPPDSRITRIAVTLAVVGLCSASPTAQISSGPDGGTLIVDGGAGTKPVVARFVEAAGGQNARIVVFATGPSARSTGMAIVTGSARESASTWRRGRGRARAGRPQFRWRCVQRARDVVQPPT